MLMYLKEVVPRVLQGMMMEYGEKKSDVFIGMAYFLDKIHEYVTTNK